MCCLLGFIASFIPVHIPSGSWILLAFIILMLSWLVLHTVVQLVHRQAFVYVLALCTMNIKKQYKLIFSGETCANRFD